MIFVFISKTKNKSRNYSRKGELLTEKNLNEYLETIFLAASRFCDLPCFYRKTGFRRSHPWSLNYTNKIFDII